jgi:hypothetical protein
MLTRPEILSRLDEELNQIKVTAQENPAVARCARSWLLFYFEARMKGKSDDSARASARTGYRLSMPPLTGSRNIRDFIACTTHAMLLDIFDGTEAARLLYAARAAHTARPSRSKPQKAVQGPVSPRK